MDSTEGWKSIFSKILIGFCFGIVSATITQFFLDLWLSGRGYVYFSDYLDYAENFYYLIVIIVFLVAIKKGTIKSSFIFSLLVSIGFIAIVEWIR